MANEGWQIVEIGDCRYRVETVSPGNIKLHPLPGGDAELTRALSQTLHRKPLSAEAAELNIRLASQIAALDVGRNEALAMLRRIANEIEAAAWSGPGSR